VALGAVDGFDLPVEQVGAGGIAQAVIVEGADDVGDGAENVLLLTGLDFQRIPHRRRAGELDREAVEGDAAAVGIGPTDGVATGIGEIRTVGILGGPMAATVEGDRVIHRARGIGGLPRTGVDHRAGADQQRADVASACIDDELPVAGRQPHEQAIARVAVGQAQPIADDGFLGSAVAGIAHRTVGSEHEGLVGIGGAGEQRVAVGVGRVGERDELAANLHELGGERVPVARGERAVDALQGQRAGLVELGVEGVQRSAFDREPRRGTIDVGAVLAGTGDGVIERDHPRGPSGVVRRHADALAAAHLPLGGADHALRAEHAVERLLIHEAGGKTDHGGVPVEGQRVWTALIRLVNRLCAVAITWAEAW